MFQDSLIEKLLEKLNNNTQGVTFRGGYLIQQTNADFAFTTYTNYYTQTTTEYVPIMFDLTSTPKNIPNKEIYDWVIDCTFSVTGETEDATDLIAQRNAIDEFRASLTNNPIDTITDGLTTYKIVTSATDISTVSDVAIVNGKKRILVSMQVFVQSGIDITYGNEAAYSIKTGVYDYEVFDTLSTSETKGKSLDTAQVFGNTTVSSVAIDGSYQFNAVVLYKNTVVHNEIVKDIILGNTLNLGYTLKIEFPNLATVEKSVILANGSINTNKGELISINLTMVENG